MHAHGQRDARERESAVLSLLFCLFGGLRQGSLHDARWRVPVDGERSSSVPVALLLSHRHVSRYASQSSG
eukprot:1300818-Lingulodinium_polyedra.AAC.1